MLASLTNPTIFSPKQLKLCVEIVTNYKKYISTCFFFHRNQFNLFPLTEVVITTNEADSFITHYFKEIHVHLLTIVFFIVESDTVKSIDVLHILQHTRHYRVLKLNSVALVRERTIPTERPPPVDEVVPTFAGRGVSRGQRNESPRPFSVF